MKNLFKFNAFVSETKKTINEAKKSDLKGLFNKDVKNILDDMFAKVKKPKYEYNKEGYPIEVEFEIDKADFFIEYKTLTSDFSEGVLKKREYIPVLTFDQLRKLLYRWLKHQE